MPSGRAGFVTLVVGLAGAVACGRRAQDTSAPALGDAAPAAPADAPLPGAEPPSVLAVPSASVQAIVNPAKLPAYDGPTGSLEGTVFVQGPSAPDVPALDFTTCPAAIDTYGKLFRAGPLNAAGLRPLADAVVVVTGYGGYYVPEKEPAHRVTITANCGYPSLTIAMTFGQRLEVANDSKIPFAPVLVGILQPAVMIAPPGQNGDPVKLYPAVAGHYAMNDRMQAFVREDVYVLRHPLHAVTDLTGHYRIDGIPVGKLKVGALQHAIRSEAERDIEVRPHVVEKVDLVLTYSPQDLARRGDGGPSHVIP